MGFELDGFIGRMVYLRSWSRQLTAAVVCPLSGEIGLVPLTMQLRRELAARLGVQEQREAVFEEAARRWAAEASAGTVIAYFRLFEFGDRGRDSAVLWHDRREVATARGLQAALHYFQHHAGADLGSKDIALELEKYRGESAAEKWAAAARRDSG
jgi:hypothetical protein